MQRVGPVGGIENEASIRAYRTVYRRLCSCWRGVWHLLGGGDYRLPARFLSYKGVAVSFIGIDPGKKGGIAIIDEGFVNAVPMPLAGKDIDARRLASLLSTMPIDRPAVVIEKVHSMPKQGVASTFTFGTGFGILIGICAALGYPMALVTPQTWKAEILKGTKRDKNAAIAFARMTFPMVDLIPAGCRTISDGLADALCLAEYGRRRLGTR